MVHVGYGLTTANWHDLRAPISNLAVAKKIFMRQFVTRILHKNPFGRLHKIHIRILQDSRFFVREVLV